MNATQPFINQSVSLLAKYFGDELAKMYGDFYKDKSEEVVLSSVKELLSEYIGEQQALVQIKQLSHPK